jgi:hypothetical protein
VSTPGHDVQAAETQAILAASRPDYVLAWSGASLHDRGLY